MSIRKTILEAIVTELNTGTPGGVPQAERSRGFDVEQSSLPHIGVRPVKEPVERLGRPAGPAVRRRLIAAVECRAAGDATTTPEDANDPLLEWVTKKLGGSRLGGVAHEVEELEIQWAQPQVDVHYSTATVFVTVSYQTLVNDATVSV